MIGTISEVPRRSVNYPRLGHQGVNLMPRGVYPRPSVESRFWSHVDPCRTDGCALWLGSLHWNGYGSFCVGGRENRRAHHFLVGRPPKGLEWDHVKERGCTHRNCVWPEHLELVTHLENVRRSDAGSNHRNKTHCPRGHAYDEANTYVYRGHRGCRACNRARARRRQEEQRG